MGADVSVAIKPHPLPMKPENIAQELKDRDQWVCWCYEWNYKRKKWEKIPLQAQAALEGRRANASTNDYETWSTFEKALAAYQMYPPDPEGTTLADLEATGEQGIDGIGFCLAEDDNLCGADADDCLEDGQITSPDVERALELLAGTYVEVSPSDKGLRFFCVAKKPGKDSKRNKREIYDGTRARYLTVTGHSFSNTPNSIAEKQEAINTLYAVWLPPKEKPVTPTAPRGSVGTPIPDEKLLEKTFASKKGPATRRLWGATSAPMAMTIAGPI